MLVEGTWPTSWKSGIVIPISKPGKDKFRTEGYRPITLLNTMCKLLEKILNHRLNWLKEKKLLFLLSSERIQKKTGVLQTIGFKLKRKSLKHSTKNKLWV